MPQKDQVISVSMTLDTKGFKDGLVLSNTQAKTMGKTIANALTIDPKAPIAALKTIGIEKDKLIANFKKLNQAMKDSFNLKAADSKALRDKLKEVGDGFKNMGTQATAAAKAIKEVKFVIGTTNKNIKSVTDRLIKLEEVAKRIGNMSITVTTGGSIRTGGGGGAAGGVKAGNTYAYPAGPNQIPIQSRGGEYSGIGPRPLSAQELKNYQQKMSGQASYGSKPTAMSAAQIAEFNKAGQASADAFSKGFKTVNTKLDKQAKTQASAFSRIFGANFLADALTNSLVGLTKAFQSVIVETTLYAARTEELGVVLTSLARINNVSTATIVEQEVAVKRLNITTQDARETIARFMNVGFDVKQAGPLARVAQDLAVIGNLSTSEELDKLVVAIQTLQSRNLRSAGVFITVDEVLDRLSQTTGRARDSFTTLEKQQAVLSATLDYGARVAGTYEAAMETVSKQLRSMDRLWKEAQNAVGEGMVPALEAFVFVGTKVLKLVTLMPNSFLNLIGVIGSLTTALVLLKTTAAQTLVTGVLGFGQSLAGSITGKGGPSLSRDEARAQASKVYGLKQERTALAEQLRVRRDLNASRADKTVILREKVLADVDNDTVRRQYKKAQAIDKVSRAREKQLNVDLKAKNEEVRLAKGGLSGVDKFVGALGQIAVVGSIAATLYTGAKAINEYSNSLYQLDSIDLSAAKKNADDLKQIALDVDKVKNLRADDTVGAKEVIENLNTLSRARLSNDLKTLDVNTQITDQMKQQLLTQLQLTKDDLERKKEDALTKSISQIQKSSYNVAKSGGDLDSLREAEQTIRERLQQAGGRVDVSQIGAADKILYHLQNTLAGLGQAFSTQSVADNWAGFADRVGGDSAKLTMALADVQDELSKQGALSEAELEKRKAAIKDYLTLSELQGKSGAETLGYLQEKGGLTAKEFAEAAVVLKTLQEEARKDIEIKIKLSFQDPTQATFSSFLDAFNKQREGAIKRLKETLESYSINDPVTGKSRKLTQAEKDERLKNFSRDSDVNYLRSQTGLEGLDSLEKSIAAELARNNGSKSGEQILKEQLDRISKEGPDGQRLVEALNLLKEGGKFNQEAIDIIDQYRKESEYIKAQAEGRRLQVLNVGEAKDIAEQKESNKGLDDFIQGSIELGKSAQEIDHVRYLYKLLYSIDPKQAIESLREFNSVNKEAIALRDAQRENTDAKNPEIQRLKNLTAIQQVETALYEFRLAEDPTLVRLQQELKVEQAIKGFKDQQRDLEAEISILKVTSTLPAINSQLLIEKEILTTIQDRKKEEQQLTADLAIEIDKRRRYSLSSAREVVRISAQAFLDAQRGERETQEGAIKNVLGLALQTNNTSAFENNPLIREAVKQADALAEIEKKGGLQIVKMDEQKDVQIKINDAQMTTNQILRTLPTDLTNAMRSAGFGGGNVPGVDAQGIPITGFDRIYNAFVGQESGGNHLARNGRTGATGLGQILPKYFQSYANLAGLPQVTFDQYKKDPNVQRAVTHNSMQKLYQQALQMAGGDTNLATRMLASRWYSGSFTKHQNYNRFRANEPSIGEYADQIIGRATGVMPSPTRNVETKIRQQSTAKRTAVALPDNLTMEEVYALANGQKPEDIGTLLATASLFKQYGGNAFATGTEGEAIGNTAKDITDKLKTRDLQEATRKTRAYNAMMLQDLEYTNIMSEYEDELNEFNNVGTTQQNFAARLAIVKDRNANLSDKNSSEYFKVVSEAELARAQRFYDLRAETIKLENEDYYRTTNQASYKAEQADKFFNEQTTQQQQLQDQSEAIAMRETEYLKENSKLRDNILEQEKIARREAAQSQLEELDALKRYNTEYLNSEENRLRISRDVDKARGESYRDLTEEMIKLDAEFGKQNENMQLELLVKQRQIRNAEEREYTEKRLRQLELEEEYRRKSDPYDKDEFRNRTLEKITSTMKSATDITSELFNDAFDDINGGFGSLVDKMTAKMGIFGNTIGNLLKSIFGNILSGIGKRLLDYISPTNPDVAGAIAGTGASAVGGAAGDVLQWLNLGGTGASAAGGGGAGTDIKQASSSTAGALVGLAQAAGAAATALVQIAGQVGGAAYGIAGVLSRGVGGGARGGTGSSAHESLHGLLGGGLNTISQITNSSTNLINTAITPLTSGAIIARGAPTGGGNEFFSLRKPPTNATATATSSATKSALSGLFGKGGLIDLKGIGTSAAQAAPMLGASLGGLLGGSSVIGQGLGSIGGGLLGTLGGAVGLSLLGGTGVTGGAIASIAGFLGISGAATLGIGAAIGGALLLGSYLFGRAKRRKEEKKKVTTLSGDARKQLEELLKGVRTDKIDGTEAMSRAQEIRDAYVKEISTLKTKPAKKQAQQELTAMDALIAQIGAAAKTQTIRKELDERIVPTYATGGVGSGMIRVSRGESLFVPNSGGSYSGGQIAAGNIPNFATGGTYTGVKIRGSFDGKDNILARVPKGTVIANPRQASKIRQSPRFATGGVAFGRGGSPTAQGSITVQPPSVTAIIVFSQEEAEKLGNQIPNSVIVGKMRQHVKQTGTTGFAGDVLNSYRG